MYFYHPDHLGSSSYITDREGRITQHTEYIAFGEVLFEEHSTSKTMPYLFNGKELDQETNLTYFGARYLDMKTSLWLNVDPLAEKTMTPYTYTNNNPIMFVDPTGMKGEDWVKRGEQIFYDEKIKSQIDAEKTYGKGTEHLEEGSSLITSQGNKIISKYTFHSNGTYTDMNNNVMDNTKNLVTSGGTTIFANCNSCLNPGSLYKNLFGLSYPGGNNPRTYGGNYSYEYIPKYSSEYPAIGHDRRYDNLRIEGIKGLLTDTRAIGADWRFVLEEFAIANNVFNNPIDRVKASALGIGLGVLATPKTIYQLSKADKVSALLEIILYYKASNIGVTNIPDKR